MKPIIEDRNDTDNFVIENNVVKGIGEKIEKNEDIGQVIWDTLNGKPNHIAQIDGDTGKQSTFADLKDRSARCAIWLEKQSIGHGDIVGVCSDNHLDTYVPILSTFYIGAITNSWNCDTPLKPLQYLMQLFKPKVIFACESIAEVLLNAAKLENVKVKIIVFGHHPGFQSFDDILNEQTNEEVKNFSPKKIENPSETVSFITLSSGSTGFPKGVMHSYSNTYQVTTRFGAFILKNTSLWYSSTFWITGLIFPLQSIFSLGTRIIHREFDPESTCKIIEKYKVQRMFMSPNMINYLCKTNVPEKYNLESLEIILTGGSKPNIEMCEDLKRRLPKALLLQSYGMSEIGLCCMSQMTKNKSNNSVGFTMPFVQAKIVDVETSEILGKHKVGEICLKTSTVMLGYYKNPNETKKVIDDEGWLHSGDVGYYDENGELYVVDRIKDVMKYQNHQISPSEIEEILVAHPDVVEAAVAPIPHELDGDHPVAFVKKIPGSNVTEEELVNLSLTLGEKKKLRGGVRFVDELPRTATGKILRVKVKEMAKVLAQNQC